MRVLIVLLVFAMADLSAREFTDAKGRKIEAELVAHAGKKVIISSGGKEYTVAANSFSLNDQAYIAKWIEDNPDAVRFAFRYFVDLDQGIKQNAKVDYDERLQTIPMNYSISVSNQSPGPLENAAIQCMVFVEDFVDTRNDRFRSLNSGIRPRSGRIQRFLVKAPVSSLKPDGRMDLDIEFPIHYYVDRDGGKVDNAVKDVVLGVWVRVRKGDRVLADRVDAEDDKKMKSVEWKEKGTEKAKLNVELR